MISVPVARLRGAGGEPPRLRLYIKWKRPDQARQANVPKRKKAVFLLFSSGYLTPRDWALELDWGSHLSR
ncbi:hypothetical protein FZC78_06030 [Rossellomorea vietnamensis]|uniref:Uncharacterized protein n=1 Tax=Rossellomorea vietnamensis TaxID=218284 RepID=A0A5D4NXJ9_9BACI|nr:hypothetical protein FZC78_06030 [Rossellomorea vietnamensis]